MTHPDIVQLQKDCAKLGKTFIYNQAEEQDDDEKQFAHFIFAGKDQGKEVIFETYLSTLSYEYHMNVLDQAEAEFFEKYPQLADDDVMELEDKYQVEYDQMIEAIYTKDSLTVQEDILIYEDEEENDIHLSIEAFLNVKEITEAVISKFIKEFNADTLELDERPMSFASEA